MLVDPDLELPPIRLVRDVLLNMSSPQYWPAWSTLAVLAGVTVFAVGLALRGATVLLIVEILSLAAWGIAHTFDVRVSFRDHPTREHPAPPRPAPTHSTQSYSLHDHASRGPFPGDAS